jgi:hypothetical protein
MKTKQILAAGVLAVLLGVPLQAAENWVRYVAQPGGGQVKVEGTSTLHDWSVESKLIGGYVELDPGFNLDKPQPGKVNARVAVLIPVRQLKSDKTAMDTIMYETMKEKDHRRIDYRLTEMTLKEAPKSADAPIVFDARGELVVAGVTNKIQMPVTMVRVGADKLKFTGAISVKMTSFGMQPPTKLGVFSTGDDVKLSFDWLTARKEEAAK